VQDRKQGNTNDQLDDILTEIFINS